MTTLLYIHASPRGDESRSGQLAEAYLSTLRQLQPGLTIDTLRLWDQALPEFDGNRTAAKMRLIAGDALDGAAASEWDAIVRIAQRFAAADRYLFAVPMWNSGVPYRLKHYIDLIHQPGLLWRLDAQAGYLGLLADKHATLMLTAGAFSPGAPSPAFGVDHHSTYLRHWLNQAGVAAIDEMRLDANLLTPDPAGDFERARQAAIELARRHAAG